MIPANFILTMDVADTEKTLGGWGLNDEGIVWNINNQTPNTFTVQSSLGRLDVIPFVPDGGRVKIFARARNNSSAGFLAGSGQKIFEGERVQIKGAVAGRSAKRHYQFAGGWYDLEQRPLMQKKLTSAAWVDDEIARTFDFTSEIVLFLQNDLTGEGSIGDQKLTVGAQLRKILEYAIDPKGDGSKDHGANFQIGVIDAGLDQEVNTYPCRDIKCAEAIRMCLRPAPQAVVWWDDTTAPPTVHVTLTRPEVLLPWADGVKHATSEMIPRYDLRLDCVLLIFKITGDVNGVQYVNYARDKYPNTPGLEFSRGTLVQTIDLAGPSGNTTLLEAPLTVAANDFAAGGFGAGAIEDPEAGAAAHDATRLSWWAKNDGTFKETARLKNVKFKNKTGTLVDKDDTNLIPVLGDFPNYVVEGTPADWMPANFKQANLRVDYSCKEFLADGVTPTQSHNKRMASAHPILTDAPVGDYVYKSRHSEVTDAGEPIPAATYIGLLPARDVNGDVIYVGKSMAQFIYEQMAVLQFEGTHTIVEGNGTWSNSIGVQNALSLFGAKLTGDLENLKTMKSPAQNISIEFSTAKVVTEVTVGPAKHLGAGDMTELFLINRFRNAVNLNSVITGEY